MNRVLVAGGAGFLGSHLVERMVSEGYDIIVVDDFSSGLERNLEHVKSEITMIQENIINLKFSDSVDVVINLASRASRREWETYPVDVALTNSIGSNNLINIALKNNARYMFASTSEIYGDPEVIPTPEEYIGKVNSVGTRSPYDEGKRFGEALVKSYQWQFGLDNVIMRFFNTYGPRMRGGDLYGRVIDRFIQQSIKGVPLTIYGNGEQTRSFTYVQDTVSAIITLLENGVNGQIYNVGNDQETRIIDLANIVKKVTQSKSLITYSKLPEDDPTRRAANIRKLKSLGWKPLTPLETGLRQMVAEYVG